MLRRSAQLGKAWKPKHKEATVWAGDEFREVMRPTQALSLGL